MSVAEDNTQNAEEQNQKHDAGYKKILSNKENFLRFIERYVHEPWTADISRDDVELVNKSFVTDEYRLLDSDVIYKLKIGKSDVYFYFLIELQSRVDFTMPFRLLKYMVALLDEIFQNTPEDERTRKGFKLPAVVPIILYNGDDSWTQVRRFSGYTKNAEVFGDCIIDFRYLLFDLKRTDDSALSSPEQLLDAVFSIDKERLMLKDGISPEELKEWWEKRTKKLSENDKFTLQGWILHILCKGVVTEEINEVFENSIKKGDKSPMKHVLEVVADRMEDNAKKKRSLEIAKKLKDKGMSVNDIVEATDLTVDEVLQL
jgi:predicted transposase/invertase (TIGR01784 family)